MTRFRTLLLLPLILIMGGCKAIVLYPAGDVAVQERDLLIFSTGLMLLIILPVMALVVFFAWKYRQSNDKATYSPDWDHSTLLELVIWACPLFIVIALGALTWMGTHLLDPYRGLGRISAERNTSTDVKPLEIDVVALDWKWLFIYPEYGVATVNQLAAPIDRPIDFHITASSVMNSFYIPALAGQIYAMPGMETRLNAVTNATGEFKGFSANYSGAGFSGMHFPFLSLSDTDFATWIADVKTAGENLDRKNYLELEQPSQNDPVHHYGHVDADLYTKIVGMCVVQGKSCMAMTHAMNEEPHKTKSDSMPNTMMMK